MSRDTSESSRQSGRRCPRSRIGKYYSRRRVVSGVAAVAVGAGAVALGTDSATADVSVESLSVSDATLTDDQVTPVVDVDIAYEYAVPEARQITLALLVDGTVVADETLRTRSAELSQETDLAGRVTRSDAWQSGQFAPAAGESVRREITVSLRLVVETADGGSVTAEASDTAVITVKNPSDGSARIGGEGVIRTGD